MIKIALIPFEKFLLKHPMQMCMKLQREKEEAFQPTISEITRYKCKKKAIAKKPKNDFFSTLFTIK